MDEFFKRLTKNEPIIKNFEAEVTTTSASPVPSTTPDINEPTEKIAATEPVQIVKDDTAHTSIQNVDAAPIDTDTLGSDFDAPKQVVEVVEKEETSNEQVVEKEETSNALEKMLEKAGEMTDFLSWP